jgi:hypothetical protein
LAPKEIASKYGVFPQISVVLGVLTAFTIGVIYSVTGLENEIAWRLQFAFPILPLMIQFIGIFTGYIPESPHSFIMKNRREDAREILALFN